MSNYSRFRFWQISPKKIPFLNTVKYIFVFKEGLNHGSWFRLKNAVLTDARNIQSVQDGPGSTILSDPLS